MKNLLFYLLFSSFLVLIFSCNKGINVDNLYGTWKYIKVESVHAQPSDTVSARELKAQAPSITFAKNGTLVIMWDGKQLSKGKFHMDANMIRYTETLPNNQTRDFPFLISKLTDDEIIFETMLAEATRVTAKRVP